MRGRRGEKKQNVEKKGKKRGAGRDKAQKREPEMCKWGEMGARGGKAWKEGAGRGREQAEKGAKMKAGRGQERG